MKATSTISKFAPPITVRGRGTECSNANKAPAHIAHVILVAWVKQEVYWRVLETDAWFVSSSVDASYTLMMRCSTLRNVRNKVGRKDQPSP